MTKFYICISPSENLTVGKKYISYQPNTGMNPNANWINVVDDSGFIHSHSDELLKDIEEIRDIKIDELLNDRELR